MKYCVNCGKRYEKPSGICPDCLSDQTIPNEIIDFELKNRGKSIDPNDPIFGFPGEKAALTLSVIISLIIAFILGAVSFGLFFLVLILNLLYLKINHLTFQKNMLRVSENSFVTT